MDIFEFLSKKKLVVSFEDKGTVTDPGNPGPGGPGPGGPGPQPSTDFDTATRGLLAFSWANNLDPIGTPDMVAMAPAYQPFAYMPPVDGFNRTNWCRKWLGALKAPVDGEVEFKVTCKSAGYVIIEGDIFFSKDREQDPGDHSQFVQTFKKTLVKGKLYPVDILFRCQSGEHVFQLEWKKPGAEAFEVIDSLNYHPVANWQSLLKPFVKPNPGPGTGNPNPGTGDQPDVFEQPDWNTYQSPSLAGVKLVPDDSAWKKKIDAEPLDPLSEKIIAKQGTAHLHPEFGSGLNGIPVQIIPPGTAKVKVIMEVPHESDSETLFPIPIPPHIEHGVPGPWDFHWIGFSPEENMYYELYQLKRVKGQWYAYGGVYWPAGQERKRPLGHTSADGAGLPILPGLVRYEEVAAGKIEHAIRFTVGATVKGFVEPANHYASTRTDNALPPMGARFRLKADVDISGYPPQAKVVLQALKEYGMIVADNGSNGFMFITGTPDARWDDNDLATLKKLKAHHFEVVKMGPVVTQV